MKRTSVWIGTKPMAHFPSLDGNIEVDVAVVGGGITGLTAARLLSRQGKKVAVLEAREIGAGDTGHSTGNLYAMVSNSLYSIRDKWGMETMQAVADSRSAALDFIEQTVRADAIDCAFARRSWHLYTTPEGREHNEAVEKEFEALRQAGLNPQYVQELPLPLRIEKAVKVDNQAQFDPFAYTQGLAGKLMAMGCPVFRQTPVTEMDADQGVVRTAKGSVKCAHIVLATHTPKGVHAVQMQMQAALELGLACRLAQPSYPQGIFWGMGKSTHSLRSFEAHGQQYLVLISDKYPTGHEADMQRHVAELEAFARAHFQVASVDYLWAAEHYRAADGLPFIGRSRGHANLYLATGFFTDGLVYGTLAAMIIADSILGRDNPWAKVYDATRIDPVKAAKGTLQETLHVARHLAKDYLTNKNVEPLQRIKPGDGGLIDTDDGKVAVYRDELGRITALSPVCTHLRCIVHWNNAMKTWDCPCHGSRFDVDGTVLEGPALQPLPRVPVE